MQNEPIERSFLNWLRYLKCKKAIDIAGLYTNVEVFNDMLKLL